MLLSAPLGYKITQNIQKLCRWACLKSEYRPTEKVVIYNFGKLLKFD